MKLPFIPRKPIPTIDDSARRKELARQVDAEEAKERAAMAEASQAELARGETIFDNRRISRATAEKIKRQIIGPRRRFFTLEERMRFLEQYEVIQDEPPLPIPESPTHHAEIMAARQARQANKPPTPKPKTEAKPKGKYTTFFT